MLLSAMSKIRKFCSAILAVSSVLAIIAVSISSIVVGPLRETLLIPVKDIRSLDMPVDFQAENSAWNVVIVSWPQLRFAVGF